MTSDEIAQHDLQIEAREVGFDIDSMTRAPQLFAPALLTAAQILDRAMAGVAAENGIPAEKMTDYKFCKLTGYRQQTVSSWRRGKTLIAREYAATFARLAHLPEEFVYACLEHDRHSDPTVKRILYAIAERFKPATLAILAAMLLGGFLAPQDVRAASGTPSRAQFIHYA